MPASRPVPTVKLRKAILLLTETTNSLREVAKQSGISRKKIQDIAKLIREGADPQEIINDNMHREAGIGTTAKKDDLTDKEIGAVNILEGKLNIRNDEIRTLRRQLKVAQQSAVQFDAVIQQVSELIDPFDPPPAHWKKLPKGRIKESAVLHLSDGHHDSVIEPHKVQGLERHDFNIAMSRGEYLVDTLINFTQNDLPTYQFDELWILAYGDHTQGEIHKSVKYTHFGNMFKNSLAIGAFHAQMFRDLSAWFPTIKVLYLSGNHGRRADVAKKDYQQAQDSWDYLIGSIAKSHCSNLSNVEFVIPDSFSAVVNIQGKNFCVFHGDDIKGWAGIPWYGIERKTRRLTALNAAHDHKVDYYCMGHFHALATQAALKGETFINGSWVGCDPFSFNALSGYNEPMQLLHGVHREHGVSWRLPIKLKQPSELTGSSRYICPVQ